MKLLSAVASATFLAVLTPSVRAQMPVVTVPTTPTLTITGRGEVAAAPDRAVVRLGAIAQAEQASDAQGRVNEIMNRALADIRALGIPEELIGTTGLSLSPVYSTEGRQPPQPLDHGQPKEPRIVGYRASNVIRVELTDLKRVGDVIDRGVAAGANRLEGLSFELRDDSGPRGEALRKAVADARAKAQAIAEAMGVRLDAVSEITEGGVSILPSRDQYGGTMARLAASAEAAPTPVQPGQVQVEATVTVRYSLGQTSLAR